jgi:hypothetical protein
MINLEDQILFSSLSGDNNPIHIDPIYARRSIYGAPIVHGINQVLHGLEKLTQTLDSEIRIIKLSSSFKGPLFLNRKIDIELEFVTENECIISIGDGATVTTQISVSFSEFERLKENEIDETQLFLEQPKVVDRNEISNCSGILDKCANISLLKDMFPGIWRFLDVSQIKILLLSTKLVGTVCPGLNSIFSEIEIKFLSEDTVDTLLYKVIKFDDRFNKVKIQLSNSSCVGTVIAFLRPEPTRQNSFQAFKEFVDASEFRAERALIIGGSRGLGEVVAKIVCAGGGEVLFSHHKGSKEATSLITEVSELGGQIATFNLDVEKIDLDSLNCVINRFQPTSCYYFATPKITPQRSELFSIELFEIFSKFFVHHFIPILEILNKNNVMHLFYPSTIFVEQMPQGFTEYVSAKSAAETMIRMLNKNRNFSIYTPRLPMLATDQTLTLFGSSPSAPDSILFEALKDFCGNRE